MTRIPLSLHGSRVLVVDDSTEITALVAEVFRDCGARVVAVNTGREALTMLQFSDFDLVVLDLAMPGVDGWRLLDFMEDLNPDLLRRALVVTARSYDTKALGLLRGLGVAHLLKPFLLEDLRAAASRVLSTAGPTVAA
jgi:CheY-like chemotaxis protein